MTLRVLFGPFDRHNLGDLLFPHVVQALLPANEAAVFTGLSTRDLRPWGGHEVVALKDWARQWDGPPPSVLHVGGEILTCTAWQAAVMLLDPAQAGAAIGHLERDAQARHAWIEAAVGLRAQVPYAAGASCFGGRARTAYLASGGADLDRLPGTARAEVLGHLRRAEAVTVRDKVTQAHLAAAGVEAGLIPDPAVMTAALFGPLIARHAAQGEVAAVRARWPGGYLAVQCSAEFGDDATLDGLAGGLRRVQAETGLGIALFRAGAAPWHDDLPTLRRLAGRLPPASVEVVKTLHMWDVCALVQGSCGFVGSSLHGRILAMAFGLPRVSLLSPQAAEDKGPVGKHRAYAATWEDDDVATRTCVEVQGLAPALHTALRWPGARYLETARALPRLFCAGARALGLQAPDEGPDRRGG